MKIFLYSMDNLGFRYDNDLTRNEFPTTPQICTLYCALSGKDELYNFNTGFYLKEFLILILHQIIIFIKKITIM